MTTKKDQIKGHDFDGIQEYDNKLPRWWLGTFIITVLFGIAYWMYYYVLQGPGQEQDLAQEIALHQKLVASSETNAELNDDQIKLLIADASKMQAIKAVYLQNCLACHGDVGQGTIGPNLTDKYWIHGGSPQSVYSTIEKGVSEKGMPTWKGILSGEQIHNMVAFIQSMQGTHPANAKAPQGELVP